MNKLIINVEVETNFVDSRSGINAKGKPYEIHSQKAWAYLGSKFPKEFQINLDDPKHAYAPGVYECDLIPALDVGDFGKLVIDGRKVQLSLAVAKLAAAK
jgi:hypothetical protein